LGIPDRKVRGTGSDPGREHSGHGGRSVAGAMDGETLGCTQRCRGAGCGVLHPVETDAGGGAGDAVFLLHFAASRDFVHGRTLCGGTIRCRTAQPASYDPLPADAKILRSDLLPPAEFQQLRRDWRCGAPAGDCRGAGAAQHPLYRALLPDGAGRGGHDFFAQGLEVKGRQARAWALALLLAVGFAGVWRLQRKINAARDAMRQEQDEVLVRSPKLMKALTGEYATLAADIYWTRAVQYYGGKRLGQDTNLESLWPLLDLATTLDPHLIPVYRFGATFLSEPEPRGAGRPDLAVKLLERGLQANPDSWRLNQD